ncbi:Uncharacterized protein TCM_015786 [Theobroma cacao]|uniref:Uncharacterized protein n=1 Tax=Theobroma cacao TaxID=3641 RepID=A0A061G3U6_THECC|nr:Uncharacterized protein TCM_015786 [Theobroma cacao]
MYFSLPKITIISEQRVYVKRSISLQSIFFTDLQSNFRCQKTMRNWGASDPLAGRISQRQGSSSSDTGQNPANVTLSAVAATDPNSNTVTLSGRGTTTAPCIPGTGFGVPLGFGMVWVSVFGLPLNQERRPMVGCASFPVIVEFFFLEEESWGFWKMEIGLLFGEWDWATM